MERDEIIEMAKESNLLGVIDSFHYNQNNWLEEATAFAKLVAAKKHEELYRLAEDAPVRGDARETRQNILHAIRVRDDA